MRHNLWRHSAGPPKNSRLNPYYVNQELASLVAVHMWLATPGWSENFYSRRELQIRANGIPLFFNLKTELPARLVARNPGGGARRSENTLRSGDRDQSELSSYSATTIGLRTNTKVTVEWENTLRSGDRQPIRAQQLLWDNDWIENQWCIYFLKTNAFT